MKSTLSPSVIQKAMVLNKLTGPEAKFEPLIPVQGTTTDSSWLKVESVSLEHDANGEHLVLWRDHTRHIVYQGDAVFPVGKDRFLILREELVTYLMPAFRYMLRGEGYEPLS